MGGFLTHVGIAALGAVFAAPQDAPQQSPGAPGVPQQQLEQQRLSLEDADRDDWIGEQLNQHAGRALKKLGRRWCAGERDGLAVFLAESFAAGPPLAPPERGALHFRDGGLEVLPLGVHPAEQKQADLLTHLDGLAGDFDGKVPQRVKFKIHGVRREEDGWHTKVQVHAIGARDGRAEEAVAEWDCLWEWPVEETRPLLLALQTKRCAVVLGPADGTRLYADRSAELFADPRLYTELLAPGLDDWQRRIAASLGFSSRSQQGLAVGDVDGDGVEDIYLPQPAGLPNLLLRRNAEGLLEDVAAASGVDFLDATRAALLIDLDNDGDLDLVTSLTAELVFLENDGTGRFERRASGHVPESTMLAAADYDGDGFLDVYACRYLDPYEDQGVPLPYHDAENGNPNVLLDHDGDWTLRDVTAEVGLDANNTRFSFAAAWEDYDNDGDQDLYVANDFGRNNLFRNDGGRFTDVAAEAGVEDISAGMGVAWGDYDGDGWMDLHVSNMYSSAGKRVAFQRRFQPGACDEERAAMRRHARGNSLFRNRGDGSFEDVSEQAGVTMGRWAWGAVFTDFGNDGNLDLYVPNGFLTRRKPDDL